MRRGGERRGCGCWSGVEEVRIYEVCYFKVVPQRLSTATHWHSELAESSPHKLL